MGFPLIGHVLLEAGLLVAGIVLVSGSLCSIIFLAWALKDNTADSVTWLLGITSISGAVFPVLLYIWLVG